MRVPLLASLGAMACFTPFAHGAVTIADNDLTINIGLDVQSRAQLANASYGSGSAAGTAAAGTTVANNGQSYDVFQGRPGQSNDVDFNMRRARLLLDGAYGPDWKFYFGLNADNVDRNGDNGGGTTSGSAAGVADNDATRSVQLFKAYLRHIWKLDDTDQATLQAGLDYPFFNRAIVGDPWWLFPQQRASGNLMGNRATGARFMINGAMFDWGFDIDETMDPGQPAQLGTTAANGGNDAYHREGLFYSTRLEYTVFSDSGKKALYHEDYQGKPGTSVMLTADIGYDNNDYGVAGTRTDAYCYGFEVLVHMDNLSLLADYRSEHIKENAYATVGNSIDDMAYAYCIQAGYCIPAMGIIIEPALRAQRLVLDTKQDQQASYNSGGEATYAGGTANAANLGLPAWLVTYGGADRYNSGNIFDVGVNWIFSPYTLLQTAYTRWNGQASTGGGNHPDANILRAQFQLYF